MTSFRSSSRSDFLRARGIRHHIRRWGQPDRPMIFLGHGFLDVSATFEPLVAALLDATAGRYQVLAPDWRGFGYTEWPQDGYWFQDYVADLDAFVRHYSPDAPLTLVGHSMGAQIVSLYAGLRPERVQKLVLLDGVTLPDMPSTVAPKRFRHWLDQLQDTPRERRYPSFEDLAGRVQRQHPQLSAEHALFVARCWGREDGRGRITLCADPRHHRHGPGLYHAEDSNAIWREITADTLFIDAGKSQIPMPPEQRTARLACYRRHAVEVIAEAGHMLHFDAPRDTAQRLAAFLDR
jgi:pimeloyl-ACP methyl ester carboxylesterase